MSTFWVILLVCSLGHAFGQTKEGLPSFEVASVKPSAFVGGNSSFTGLADRRGGPGTSDPGRITFTNFPLKGLLIAAFGVMRYQIACPPWLDNERFDIEAKFPPGTTTREQLGLMLQHLLAERFNMESHREKRQLPIYALITAKSGPKLRVADPSVEPKCVRPVTEQKASERRPPGYREQVCQNLTMAAFTEWLPKLSPLDIDRVVVDATGLDGSYDLSLVWTSSGIGAAVGSEPPGPNLFNAMEKQLGLKLEPRRGPVDVVVIDRIERKPIEN